MRLGDAVMFDLFGVEPEAVSSFPRGPERDLLFKQQFVSRVPK